MQSTLKDADPHDIFAIEPSFTATRTDNAATAPAPTAKAASGQREPWFGPSLAPSSTPQIAPVASVPPVTPIPVTAPPAAPEYSAASHDGRLDDIRLERAPRPTNKWAIRAFWFVFAIVGAMGTAAWQHYGHRVKQVVAEYVPQVEALTSLLPGKATPAVDQASPPAQAAAAADQPAAAAPAAAPQDVATAAPAPAAAAVAPVAPAASAAPAAPDQTQLLQSMARDLASMGQQIEQLKTSIDQLKASQDQLTQRVARTTETRAVEPRPVAPRPRASIAPPPTAPRTAVASPPVRRSYPPAQAYIPPPPAASAAPLPAPVAAAPQTVAPRPVQPQQSSVVDADDGGPVVRPPMPLR
ncbi:hypothetical protein [Bradyrhizobium sp. C9]|uniref:hypothetical protein n=1 Tax=Bradyrhizobium sp. C9 TaxID=142585 RepID=UPI000BE96153|nr:hypothetical protein [Bradyrhizobium sp. C9]PDT73580.1 hypothetical protein CO675_30075 [Bradyrhizobium sp. C9]